MINVKEMPRRFLGSPVVKATHLTSDESQVPYRAFIVTLREDSDLDHPVYNWHEIGADSLTSAWNGLNGGYAVVKAVADAKFREYEQRWG